MTVGRPTHCIGTNSWTPGPPGQNLGGPDPPTLPVVRPMATCRLLSIRHDNATDEITSSSSCHPRLQQQQLHVEKFALAERNVRPRRRVQRVITTVTTVHVILPSSLYGRLSVCLSDCLSMSMATQEVWTDFNDIVGANSCYDNYFLGTIRVKICWRTRINAWHEIAVWWYVVVPSAGSALSVGRSVGRYSYDYVITLHYIRPILHHTSTIRQDSTALRPTDDLRRLSTYSFLRRSSNGWMSSRKL